ncbi:MAG: Hsp20/alpha crystallin family protein [Thermoplasmatota archaeon]
MRVVERDVVHGAGDIQELERRVSSLASEVSQLANLAASTRAQVADAGYLRIAQPQFFGGLNRFGPVAPGFVPPVPPAQLGAPLFGFGAPAYQVPGEAVTMKDFSAQPTVPRQPGVNVVDAGEEFVVQVEIPAIKKKDLELLGSDRSITVVAECRPDGEAEGTVILGEVAPTVFRRTIHLPAACNTARCKATLKDGILTLNIPKRDPSNGMRRIDVAYG